MRRIGIALLVVGALVVIALVPGARLVVLDGVGHIPQLEDPEAFEAALIAVLSDLIP